MQKTLANTGWMTLEKVMRLGLGLVISVFIARHLGPRDFGILSYAFSVTAFLGTFAYLGLSGIVVRDIVKHPDETGSLMGSGFALKMIGALLGYGVIVSLALLGHPSSVESWVLIITGALLLFQPMEIIDLWFQSRTESKYPVLGKGLAFLLASAGNITLVFVGASVLAFAAVTLTEFVLAFFLLLATYVYKGQSIRAWKFQGSKMLRLLRQSWILILSGFLGLVYLKIDQIMLRWMVGAEEVGIYSVAVRFSEAWYFIPSVIAVSVFPTLVEARQRNRENYEKKLQQGFDILFAIAFSIAVLIAFTATPAINFLFGPEYKQAGGILVIHIWAGVFIFMRALFSKWILMENLIPFSLYSHGLGALVNVGLNLLLIKPYGGYGAAVATLFSYAAASYFILFLSSRTRPIAIMMSKSLLLPIRMARFGKGVWG
jgi:O-antigen/teichoic acid export membrane protein